MTYNVFGGTFYLTQLNEAGDLWHFSNSMWPAIQPRFCPQHKCCIVHDWNWLEFIQCL